MHVFVLGHHASRNPPHGGAVHDRPARGQGINQSATVNKNIEHRYALVRHSDKSEAIARFLDLDPELYGVVFCRTRRDTQALAEELLKRGYRADALHGEMSQAQRDRVMLRFKQKHLQVLVATDVAARGIDVDNLTHVFHHSLPGEAAHYTHRSGRCARAGKKGIFWRTRTSWTRLQPNHGPQPH